MSKKDKKESIISTENAELTKKEVKKAKKANKKSQKIDKKNNKKIEKLAKKISKKDKISLEDARDIAEPMILAPIVEEDEPETEREPKTVSQTLVICIAIVLCVAIAMFTVSYSFGKYTDAKYKSITSASASVSDKA